MDKQSKNKRICFSIKEELLTKSKEAALTAVQIFNNPNINFKSESFIVLMNIAWTYLLHAYFKNKKIDYHYHTIKGKRKHYDCVPGTKIHKTWELKTCLDKISNEEINENIKNNLKFLIGIRNEIEHQMTTKIDNLISSKFQACCINYNNILKKLFGEKNSLDNYITFSLQFFKFEEEQINNLKNFKNVPKNIIDFINSFEANLNNSEKLSECYSYKVIYKRDSVNRENQADICYKFIPEDKISEKTEIQHVLIKNNEPPKFKPSEVINKMKELGYKNFNKHQHMLIWKNYDAKNKNKKYGAEVCGTWYWYQNWVDFVESELKKQNNINK